MVQEVGFLDDQDGDADALVVLGGQQGGGGGYGAEERDGYYDYADAIPLLFTTLDLRVPIITSELVRPRVRTRGRGRRVGRVDGCRG
ncbi:hypothetical protein, partial [Streptomyces mirabilis]|uniref:hypothetical protein n=1 Tax=Streptomyces mirabilis TaxID=68239 RepID=UPI0036BC8C31